MKKLSLLTSSILLSCVSSFAMADDLAQIYNEAKENDTQLQSALASKEEAFEAISSSRSSLLPQIDLTAGYNILRGDDDENEYDALTAGIALSQELYQRESWVSLDISEMSAREADSNYAAAQQDLIYRVAEAYFDVLRANDDLTFVQAEKEAIARQLEQTKQRFEVGLSAITDVHDAQAQYDTVLAEEVISQNNLVNSYEDLRVITGTAHSELNVLDTERFSAMDPDNDVNALIDEAQEKNLDLLAARISADIAKENISLASSGHMPSLTLDAAYDYTDLQNTGNLYEEGDTTELTAGINLYIPLYSGGETSSLTAQAEYQYVAASQDLEAVYREVTKNVRAYNNNINASIGALKAYEQSVISAQSALDATEAGFEVGTRTIVDVLDYTRALYDANRNLADARYDYITSTLQLKQAVGTLSEQDILDISEGLKAQVSTN